MCSCLCLCEGADSSCKPPVLSQTHISFSNTAPRTSDAGRIPYTRSARDCALGFVLLLCFSLIKHLKLAWFMLLHIRLNSTLNNPIAQERTTQ